MISKLRQEQWNRWKIENIDKYKDYHRQYYLNNKQKYLDRSKSQRNDPSKKEHFKARKKYNKNVVRKLSDLQKICQVCGELKTSFHHIDYSRYYLGLHLCSKHHWEAHGGVLDLSKIHVNDYSNLVK